VPLDVEALVAQLQLTAHPEGGWYRELFVSDQIVVRADGAQRAASSLIWFLLGHEHRSVWHQITGADEIWFFVDGGPLELTWIPPGAAPNRVVLGMRGTGYISSAIIPAGSWQTARPLDLPSLVQCGVSPGFDFSDWSLLRDMPSELELLRSAHPTLMTAESVG
jgi:uncharacterized protein